MCKIFYSKSNCIESFFTRNDQTDTDSKSSSNYLFEENCLHKTCNDTLTKNV